MLFTFESADECAEARTQILLAARQPAETDGGAAARSVLAPIASLPDLSDPATQLFACQLLLDPRFPRFVKQAGELYDSLSTAISGGDENAMTPNTEPT